MQCSTELAGHGKEKFSALFPSQQQQQKKKRKRERDAWIISCSSTIFRLLSSWRFLSFISVATCNTLSNADFTSCENG
jgi:hypothetical protein